MIDMGKLGVPSCETVSRLVSESHDRPMSWRERAGMRVHLAMCRYCSRFRRQIEVLQEALRRERRGDAPDD